MMSSKHTGTTPARCSEEASDNGRRESAGVEQTKRSGGGRHPAPEIPSPSSVVWAKLDNGVFVPVRRFGNPDGPRVLMTHGNGLAIDLYFPYWSLLLERFDLMLFDLRSHGRNPPGRLDAHTIPAFSRDLETIGQTVDSRFGVRPKAGVFHSVFCLAATLSPSLGAAYSALVLFDPPLYPAGMGIAHRILESSCSRAAAGARIRVRRFRSERDFVDLVKMQPAMTWLAPRFAQMVVGVLYCGARRHAKRKSFNRYRGSRAWWMPLCCRYLSR